MRQSGERWLFQEAGPAESLEGRSQPKAQGGQRP